MPERPKKKPTAPHKWTKEQAEKVRMAACLGVPLERMPQLLELSKDLIRKHYMREVETGRDSVNGLVQAALLRNALEGNVTAQIFWLKSRAGWRDRDVVTHLHGTTEETKGLLGVLKAAEEYKPTAEDKAWEAELRASRQAPSDN
jgi:hypothetical protein